MTPVSPGEVFDVGGGRRRPGWAGCRNRRLLRSLRTVLIEHEAIGGQAGTSSMIRKYPGFSQGISGAKLAQEVWRQAWIFGTTFLYMRQTRACRKATVATGCDCPTATS